MIRIGPLDGLAVKVGKLVVGALLGVDAILAVHVLVTWVTR